MGKRFGQYPLIIFLLLGLAIFMLGFSGSTTPAYSAQIIPGYGIWAIQRFVYIRIIFARPADHWNPKLSPC